MQQESKQELINRYFDRLDEMVQHFLRRMHQELTGAFERGVTRNQFVMMKIVNDHGRVTVSKVAEDLYVSLSAITALVDRLCRAGLVVRHRSEEDRRVVWLELTEEGREVVHECLEARRRTIQRYLGQLAEEDLLHMINAYEKIIDLMRQEDSRKVTK
ncbi:DNA-binding transcriptional regulator, MarR family [Desulfotomaculum arcticum]|uniref:DNA-binding transcriptional regulator, MarR family n=1 Tax=Desulfotruncus arcticus DSM 17038 TaxID=1121424 RepID=A0A1I2WZB2_9FIRM|nr:MarR family transcriptional regulator [Desulfotruncus arcticus]SFH06640.1 DNA-binding transcriptional regulator, MarR family [Desulfotomaculum arcticum] [Desulfotruncus arcticus DSM 17038]